MEKWQARAYTTFQIYLKRLKKTKRYFKDKFPERGVAEMRRATSAFVNFRFYDSMSLDSGEVSDHDKWGILFEEARKVHESLKPILENHLRVSREELAECVKIKAGISKFKSRGEKPQSVIRIEI